MGAPSFPLLSAERVGDHEPQLTWNYNRPQSVGRVRAFYGNTGMFIRALAYILANGPDGLRQTTEDAVLNANYIRAKLEDLYELPYKTASMHEVVFSDKRQAAKGVKTGDIAKRLIDYGFHPYTVSFPMIVHGALMIEPTESESLEELDLFVEAMRAIAKEVDETPDLVKTAPHSTRVSRLDEVQAARKPILRWKPNMPPGCAAHRQVDEMVNLPTVRAYVAGETANHAKRLRGISRHFRVHTDQDRRSTVACAISMRRRSGFETVVGLRGPPR